MFLAAAAALAGLASEDDLTQGRIFPALSNIRTVSLAIAVAVAKVAFERGLAAEDRPADLASWIQSWVYEPRYADYVEERTARAS